jgi:hypothetical protein
VSKGNSLRGGVVAGGGGGGATWIDGAGGNSAGIIGGACEAEDDRCPSRLPNNDRPDFPLATGVGPCPRVEAKGVWRVSLLPFFSLSIIFLMNVFASFSSAKERAAG